MACLSLTAATRISKTPTISSKSQFPTKFNERLQFISIKPKNSVLRKSGSHETAIRASNPSAPAGSSPGLYSAHQFDLTAKNVDLVLEDVRPYLIADGGNIDVVSVEDGVVSVKLQGACGSCPSSTTTMSMGIERVLKEKFGDAIKDIRQVYDEEVRETTVEAVNGHLDILRPAIKNYGGSVEVLSVESGDCIVKYVGPDSIASGIRAAIKEKFPDIENVVFTD
ncbi:hypothetical protein WN944_017211 [Citrus x changshan-huyou]|uniref:NIF system FeS cluster assembly NifU C-terminal domain-containing protein n=1 Tax=Citrus x changshan-huyou TaxID=2935761 RepID=A0AAP0MD65_9ROSI